MDILLVGCGRMGAAMLRQWAGHKWTGHKWAGHAKLGRIDVVDKHIHESHSPLPQTVHGFESLEQWGKAKRVPHIVILAVKPQAIEDACHQLKAALGGVVGDNILVISVAAGINLGRLAGLVGQACGLIRAMPNTPCAVGHGVTGFTKGQNVSQKQLDMFVYLFSTLGECVRLDNEAQIDALTAISGSGPAYFYLFTEKLAQAAMDLGFGAKDAQILAQQTFIGAAKLLEATPNATPQSLRADVTSPNGTTQAATQRFESEDDLGYLVLSACKSACKRAKEISKNH